MRKFTPLSIYFLGAILVLNVTLILAQELQPVKLPKPQTEGGKPLMQTLNERKSGQVMILMSRYRMKFVIL